MTDHIPALKGCECTATVDGRASLCDFHAAAYKLYDACKLAYENVLSTDANFITVTQLQRKLKKAMDAAEGK